MKMKERVIMFFVYCGTSLLVFNAGIGLLYMIMGAIPERSRYLVSVGAMVIMSFVFAFCRRNTKKERVY